MEEGNIGPTGLEVRTEVKPGYLKVILEGEFRMEDAKAAGARIFDFCYQTKIDKVVVDARKVTGRISLTTKIDLADSMMSTQMEYIVKGAPRLRIAHVVAEGMAEAPGFAEDLARRQGGKIFVTTSMDEALRWLEVDTESSKR
jgi:hypothetical protein